MNAFARRIAQLRLKKGVSSREMSLALGQNVGYISNIECGKALPSMASFFYICDYLGVTPSEFFDVDSHNPETLHILMEELKLLDDEQLETLLTLVRSMLKHN